MRGSKAKKLRKVALELVKVGKVKELTPRAWRRIKRASVVVMVMLWGVSGYCGENKVSGGVVEYEKKVEYGSGRVYLEARELKVVEVFSLWELKEEKGRLEKQKAESIAIFDKAIEGVEEKIRKYEEIMPKIIGGGR